MKKKYELHLDAAIVLLLLFLFSLGMNYMQYRNYKTVSDENYRLQLKGLENSLNLKSQQTFIEKLKKQLDDCTSG